MPQEIVGTGNGPQMKYIIIKNQFGDETAILFDEILDHQDVAACRPVVSGRILYAVCVLSGGRG